MMFSRNMLKITCEIGHPGRTPSVVLKSYPRWLFGSTVVDGSVSYVLSFYVCCAIIFISNFCFTDINYDY